MESILASRRQGWQSDGLTSLWFYLQKRRTLNMKYGITYSYWGKDWEGCDYPQKIERARR